MTQQNPLPVGEGVSNLISLMKPNKPWLPLAVLAVALLLWAALFAAGAYLELGADKPRHDLRKPVMVMGAMAIFLSLWGLALWTRARRRNR